MKLKVTITELTHDDLVNLIETATYGSEWLSAHCPVESREMYKSSEYNCHSEALAEVLLKGGKIIFTDHYDEDEEDGKDYLVDLKQVLRGLNKFLKKYPSNFEDVTTDSGDYYTWNNAVQMIIFGDLVYG